MPRPKIKICGMKYASNIAEVASLLPDYLGFIFYNKSKRYIEGVSTELIQYIPAPIKTVGVFVDEDLEIVKSKIHLFRLKAVQLHGKEDANYCKELLDLGVEVIKAFGVDEGFDFEELYAYQDCVTYFLFDTKTSEHGGSGRQFNWKLLNQYLLEVPYFLSGGIGLVELPEVLKISDSRLYAVDVNSKFELEPGLKNLDEVRELMEILKSKE